MQHVSNGDDSLKFSLVGNWQMAKVPDGHFVDGKCNGSVSIERFGIGCHEARDRLWSYFFESSCNFVECISLTENTYDPVGTANQYATDMVFLEDRNYIFNTDSWGDDNWNLRSKVGQ